MLIKSLSLKEFKCFEQVDIDFGKITLLTGANSSGKSSLINALLGIMQSKYFPQYFALNGELVNMGGFDNVLRKNAKEKVFEVEIIIGNNETYSTKWTLNTQTEQPILIEFKNQDIQITKNENDSAIIELYLTEEDYLIAKKIASKKEQELTEEDIIFDLFNNPLLIQSIRDGQYQLIYLQNSDILIKANKPFNDAIKSLHSINFEYKHIHFFTFNYLGSFRLPPERTYYRKPKSSKVGVSGEGYIDQIIEWEESDLETFQKLLEAVSDLGLFHAIESNKMKGGRFELNVKVNENSALASLTDVGFGISQFLPIIVADLQLDDNSCLAVSQPEIHLHPKIQATLGDYFAKQVRETEKQYIVETHSEYLINRLRLLIVKGELQPEDVKLYYMENDGDKTTTYPIELTTDGQIKNAPQGFFDTYEMDVMDIALFASAQ